MQNAGKSAGRNISNLRYADGPPSLMASQQIDGVTMKTVTDFIFLGCKITVDGDCSHEIKRYPLLERKVMTNLHSILRSRDITLPTKVCIVKAMVFPVFMYRCENWTVKRLSAEELMHSKWSAGEDFWDFAVYVSLSIYIDIYLYNLRFCCPLDSKEIKPVNPKWNQPWIFIGRTDAGAPIFWPLDGRASSLEKTHAGKHWRQEEKGEWGTEDEMVEWYRQLNGHEFEQTPGDGKRQGSLECCNPRGCKNLTWLSDWTTRSTTSISIERREMIAYLKDKIFRISILDPILCSLRLPYHHTLGSDVHTSNIYCTGKHGGSAIYFWNIGFQYLKYWIIGTGNWSWFTITKSTYVSKYIFNAKLNTLIFRVTIWCLPHTFQIHAYCYIMDIIHHKDSIMGHWDYGLIWNLHTPTVYFLLD